MRKLIIIMLLFTAILISGCTTDNPNALPSQCPYSDEPLCFNVSSQSAMCIGKYVFLPLKAYGLENLSVSFEQIRCGAVQYANRQEVEATISFNGQTGKIDYKGSGGGSSGNLDEWTTVTIPNYKTSNKELYTSVTNAICDYFNECPHLNESSEEYVSTLQKACKNAYDECMNRGFEEADSNKSVSIIISHSVTRIVSDLGSTFDILNSVAYKTE